MFKVHIKAALMKLLLAGYYDGYASLKYEGENLLYTGDKAYWCGNGWWRIHCYNARNVGAIKAHIQFLEEELYN